MSFVQRRHERDGGEEFEDGWERDEPVADSVSTVVTDEHAKTLMTSNSSSDMPFSVSLNLCRGCGGELSLTLQQYSKEMFHEMQVAF